MTIDPTTLTPSTAPTSPKALTATELRAHPAFPTNDWTAKIPPTSTGYAPINSTSARPGAPFTLYYELHGTGPIHVLWIMGLGAFHTAWKRQTKYFGHDRGDAYTCLVFDNRGIGRSGKPTSRYSTREMAADVLELLVHVGWLESVEVESIFTHFYGRGREARPGVSETLRPTRELVVAGVSMGGMIAQEVALLIPGHIRALVLVSTAPRLVRTVPFLENLRQRINMFVPRDVDVQLEEIAHRLFSRRFLETRDTENVDEWENFPLNRDRFAASELAKRADKEGFTRKGFMLQAVAAGWHHKSAEQLAQIVREVGGERICVMHGNGDRMITFRHFELFREEMGEGSGIDYRVWDKDQGHVLMWEEEEEFNKAVEEVIEKTGRVNK